jgi:two-component system NtrC family sensor kinase
MKSHLKLGLWSTVDSLRKLLSGLRDAPAAGRYALRTALELTGSTDGCFAVLSPGRDLPEVLYRAPSPGAWDVEMLGRCLRYGPRGIPSNVYIGIVNRKERPWGILSLRDPTLSPVRHCRQAVRAIASAVSDIVTESDDRRVHEVRERIDRKLMEQYEPKDVLYTILHGLRSLIRYDHSSSLLLARPGAAELELVAEQIAWTKGKSTKIGTRRPLPPNLIPAGANGRVHVFDRRNGVWTTSEASAFDPKTIETNHWPDLNPNIPPEGSLICAPFRTPEDTVAVLRVASRAPGSFGAYEARLVDAFVPQVSLAVQYSVQRETYHERILDAQRRQTIVNVTRGIAHDVNNALGAVLLILQQMQADLEAGKTEPDRVARRLQSSEKGVQTCRRIFDGMLAVARGSTRRAVGHGNLRRAVESALGIYSEALQKRQIAADLRLPADLPAVRCGQNDLASVFLNLIGNAKDAMPGGGRMTISGVLEEGRVTIEVTDTGTGIPEDNLNRVGEPFFSTKTAGTGLGLSICQAILADVGGRLRIESREGRGTTVRIRIPVVAATEGGAP